jgi:hypothetical protein
VAFHL